MFFWNEYWIPFYCISYAMSHTVLVAAWHSSFMKVILYEGLVSLKWISDLVLALLASGADLYFYKLYCSGSVMFYSMKMACQMLSFCLNREIWNQGWNLIWSIEILFWGFFANNFLTKFFAPLLMDFHSSSGNCMELSLMFLITASWSFPSKGR